jgi:hypothetical protein
MIRALLSRMENFALVLCLLTLLTYSAIGLAHISPAADAQSPTSETTVVLVLDPAPLILP